MAAGRIAHRPPFCLESAVSATSPLDLSILPDRAVVRVAPRGEIDLANRDVLDDQLRELWDAGWRHVVVELSEVPFLDSSGLHVLAAHHRRAVGAGLRFTLADCSPQVLRVLALTGMDQVLDCAPATPAGGSPVPRLWTSTG
jgi:anti-sigma B factor antagonist